MAQPTSVKRAMCPWCRHGLKLVLRVPKEVGTYEGFEPGEAIESRAVVRSEDQGAALLWVRQGDHYEEIMRDSSSGPGPDGDAEGKVECELHGALSVDALCAHYEGHPDDPSVEGSP